MRTAGIEPATFGFGIHCSTAELSSLTLDQILPTQCRQLQPPILFERRLSSHNFLLFFVFGHVHHFLALD